MGAQIEALSDGAATGLIIAIGAGGSFVVVLALTVLAIRRSEREAARDHHLAAVGGAGKNGRGGRGKNTAGGPEDGQDAYPPQPYSADRPRSHRPYSQSYKIPRQDAGPHHTNGSPPPGSSGVPSTPWPPTDGED
ncbi:MAG: hypothetical protein ACRDVE_20960 [Actinocrinis sp.]